MNVLELSKKSFFILLLSLMALVMLPGCSSTEETETSSGVPCDIDPGQPECLK